jgi:hypothetical protein
MRLDDFVAKYNEPIMQVQRWIAPVPQQLGDLTLEQESSIIVG